MTLEGNPDVGRVGEFLGWDAVEAHAGREPRHMHGGADGQRPAHAETHRGNLAAEASQVVDRTTNVLVCGAGKIEAVHQVAGLVRLLRDAALVEVGRQCVEPGAGEAVGDAADLVVEPPPFLDHHHTRTALPLQRQPAAASCCRRAA
jgi:hypothetical protein